MRILFLCLALCGSVAHSDSLTWFTSFNAAQEEANRSGHPLIILFLDDQPASAIAEHNLEEDQTFHQAAESAVLVKLNIPRKITASSTEEEIHNYNMAVNARLDTEPALMVCDANLVYHPRLVLATLSTPIAPDAVHILQAVNTPTQ